MNALKKIDGIAARLSASALADVLTAGFDAFEAIRAAARACEDSQPELLAAFMMAAGAAVRGRNALAAAPSLLPGRCDVGDLAAASPTDVDEVADVLAEVAGLLADRMSAAAATAADADDKAACAAAAGAARQVHELLAVPPR